MRFITVALIVLSSCSHVYVSQWSANEVTACCPSGKVFCTRSKQDDLAAEKCGGSAVAVSGEMVESGAIASSSFGYVHARATHDDCVTYRCGGPQ